MPTKGLPREQAMALLHKFATDDGFRNQFSADPAKALQGAGVAPDVIAGFQPEHFGPTPLPAKNHFANTYQALSAQSAQERMAMVVPFLNLSFGEPEK